MGESKKIWSGAAAVIIAENRILMIEDKESMACSIPSGGIEEGESPEQAYIH